MNGLDVMTFTRALARSRRRLLARAGLRGAAAGTLAYALARLAGLTPQWSLLAGLAGLSLAALTLALLGRSRWPTADRFAEHLNRRFPPLEESAQLWLPGREPGDPLNALQRHRVEAAWLECLGQSRLWLPPLQPATPLAAILLALVLIAGMKPFHAWIDAHVAGSGTFTEQPHAGPAAALIAIEARIRPPAYTGLPETIASQPDLTVIAGSDVAWTFTFDGAGDYRLELSNRKPQPLDALSDDRYTTAARINSTQLYRIYRVRSDGTHDLIGVFGIEAVPDRPPVVRFLPPNETVLEFARDEAPRFTTHAQVTDDFGVGAVEIRASVARGAGEGVKFRDELLTFDSSMMGDDSIIYQRSWDLEQLGMAPGEEIYFFVNAFDNRAPDANRGRSDTVVVRWLDEVSEDLAEAGIAVDVMPEYFKSQRQIIIETEQLITDRALVDPDVFDGLSRALGQDQSSLKQRYGQYLGDETEGLAAAPSEESERDSDAADPQNQEHHEDESHAHEDSALDGAAALIAQYMHEHEAAEVGPITQRNPVGLMKRALGQMWQAELHLLLSDPERALPYEYEALKYLNLARQAERIYTQRLGFEPPPVTEDRRLTGNLDDIKTYHRDETAASAEHDQQIFARAFDTLSRPERIDDERMAQLREAADRLAQHAASRPALLSQAAALERWMADPDGTERACTSCRSQLAVAFWSLIEAPEPPPVPGRRSLSVDDPMTMEFIRSRSAPATGTPSEQER